MLRPGRASSQFWPQMISCVAVVLLLAAAGPAAAIYEDQAGTFDWYKQFVGRPQAVYFTPGKERVYVVSQQNLLASLNTKSGAVAWRRQYTQQDSLDAVLVLQSPALVLAASNGGKTLRAWDAMEGGFRWEALVFEGPASSSAGVGAPSTGLAAVQLHGQRYPAVAVAAGNTIKLLSASKGEEVWSSTLEDAAAEGTHKQLLVQQDGEGGGAVITLVAYTPGSRSVAIASYAASDGSSTGGGLQEVSAAAPLGGSPAAVSGSSLGVLSQDGQQLCVVTAGAASVTCESLSSLAPGLLVAAGGKQHNSVVRLAAAAPGSFSLSSPAGVALISAGSSGGSLEQLHWSAAPTAASTAAAAAADGSMLGLITAAAAPGDATSISIQLLSATSGQEIEPAAQLQLPVPTHPVSGPAPTVAAAWMMVASSSDAAAAAAAAKTKRKDTDSSSSSSSSVLSSKVKLLVLWSDDQLSFVEGGQVVWTREEALASTTASLLLELPSGSSKSNTPSSSSSSSGGEDGSDTGDSSSSSGSKGGSGGLLAFLQDKERVRQWVRLQQLGVYVQFRLNTDAEKEEYYQLRSSLSDNNLPYRDTNGFRKLIVVLTGPGKVFGLHSGDGRILWTSNEPAAAAATADSSSSSSSTSRNPKQYLRLWRRFHDLTHAPQVVVLSANGGGGGGGGGSGQQQQSGLYVLNAHTGQLLQHSELPYGVDKVIPIQAPVHDGAAEQFSFMLLESASTGVSSSSDDGSDGGDDGGDAAGPTPRVHLVPDTPSVRAAVAANSKDTFFWTIQQQQQQQQTTVLRGYSLTADSDSTATATAGTGAVLPVVPAWQVVLPGPLLGLATRDPAEPVHSYVKILGDRSLKYKYINPNLLFVATASNTNTHNTHKQQQQQQPHTSAAAAAAASGSDKSQQQEVSVVLINTVSGAVLYQQVHAGAAGPVHAVVSEHWVVYSFRDLGSMRQQVTVVELYDASPRDLSIESIVLGRTQHAERLSSYSSMSLETLTQSFYLQHAIKGLGVSQTLQGIATKQLLLHTMHDQVYALDKRYLDPRRPLAAKATPQEAEEGLVPYSELIIFNTLGFPTQDKQVFNLRGVTSAPAVLESTSLLFAYGTDLFFTRITPAAHFDSLQSDFSYGLLVVALLALLIGTLVVRRSSQQAMLKAKWQ